MQFFCFHAQQSAWLIVSKIFIILCPKFIYRIISLRFLFSQFFGDSFFIFNFINFMFQTFHFILQICYYLVKFGIFLSITSTRFSRRSSFFKTRSIFSLFCFDISIFDYFAVSCKAQVFNVCTPA